MALRYVYQISCNLNKTARTIQNANHFRSLSPSFNHVMGYKKIASNHCLTRSLPCQASESSINSIPRKITNLTPSCSGYKDDRYDDRYGDRYGDRYDDRYEEETEVKPQKPIISSPYTKPRRARRFPLKERLNKLANYYKRKGSDRPEGRQERRQEALEHELNELEHFREEETYIPSESKLNVHPRYRKKNYHLEDSVPPEHKNTKHIDVYNKLSRRVVKRTQKVVPHLQPNNIRPYGSSKTIYYPPAYYTKRLSAKISLKAMRRKKFRSFQPTTAPYNFDDQKFIKRKKSRPKMSWHREYSTSTKPHEVVEVKNEGIFTRTKSFFRNLIDFKSATVPKVIMEVPKEETTATQKSVDWEKCEQIISMYKQLNPTQELIKKSYPSGSNEEKKAVDEAMDFVAKCTRNYQLERFGKSKSQETFFLDNNKREENLEKPGQTKSSINLDNTSSVTEKITPPTLSYSDMLKISKPKPKPWVIYPNSNCKKNLYSAINTRSFTTSSQISNVSMKIPHRIRGFKSSSKCQKSQDKKSKKKGEKKKLVRDSECYKPKPSKGLFTKIADYFRARDCPSPEEMEHMKLRQEAEKAAAAAGLKVCGEANIQPRCRSTVKPCPLCTQLKKPQGPPKSASKSGSKSHSKKHKKKRSKVNKIVSSCKHSNPKRVGLSYTFNPHFNHPEIRTSPNSSENLQVEGIDPRNMKFTSSGPSGSAKSRDNSVEPVDPTKMDFMAAGYVNIPKSLYSRSGDKTVNPVDPNEMNFMAAGYDDRPKVESEEDEIEDQEYFVRHRGPRNTGPVEKIDTKNMTFSGPEPEESYDKETELSTKAKSINMLEYELDAIRNSAVMNTETVEPVDPTEMNFITTQLTSYPKKVSLAEEEEDEEEEEQQQGRRKKRKNYVLEPGKVEPVDVKNMEFRAMEPRVPDSNEEKLSGRAKSLSMEQTEREDDDYYYYKEESRETEDTADEDVTYLKQKGRHYLVEIPKPATIYGKPKEPTTEKKAKVKIEEVKLAEGKKAEGKIVKEKNINVKKAEETTVVKPAVEKIAEGKKDVKLAERKKVEGIILKDRKIIVKKAEEVTAVKPAVEKIAEQKKVELKIEEVKLAERKKVEGIILKDRKIIVKKPEEVTAVKPAVEKIAKQKKVELKIEEVKLAERKKVEEIILKERKREAKIAEETAAVKQAVEKIAKEKKVEEKKAEEKLKGKKGSPKIKPSEFELVKLKDVTFQAEEHYGYLKKKTEQPITIVHLRNNGPCTCDLCVTEDFPIHTSKCECSGCVIKEKVHRAIRRHTKFRTKPINSINFDTEGSKQYKKSKLNHSDVDKSVSSRDQCECPACKGESSYSNDSNSRRHYSTWTQRRFLKPPTYVCKRRYAECIHHRLNKECKCFCKCAEISETKGKCDNCGKPVPKFEEKGCPKCGKAKCTCNTGCPICGEKNCKISKTKSKKKKCNECGSTKCGCGKKKCKSCGKGKGKGKGKCKCGKQCNKKDCDCKKPKCKDCGKRKCKCEQKEETGCAKCSKCGMKRCHCKKCECGKKGCKTCGKQKKDQVEFSTLLPPSKRKNESSSAKRLKEPPPKGIPMDEARKAAKEPTRQFSTCSMYAAAKKPCPPKKKLEKSPCVTVKTKTCPPRERDGKVPCHHEHNFKKCKPQAAPFKSFGECRPPIKPPRLDECRVRKDKTEASQLIVEEMKTSKGLRKLKKQFRKYRKDKEKKGKCYSTYTVSKKIKAFHRPKTFKKSSTQ